MPTAYQDGWLNIVHPDDRARVERTYGRTIALGVDAAFWCRLVTPTAMLKAHVTMQPIGRGQDCTGFRGRTRLEVCDALPAWPDSWREAVQERQVVR